MTTFCKYRKFKKLSWYHSSGRYGDLVIGSHIMFEEHYADDSVRDRLGRVLGIATRDGEGKEIKQSRTNRDPMLAVLVPSDDLSFGYIRFVPKSRVRQQLKPNDFARWFLFGLAPSPESAQAISEYGSCNGDIGKYLTAPEGGLRGDWFEIAMGRVKPG